MGLEMATAGPCAGHPCDNCRTCRRGRCCRRDNPAYRLPGLGEWDGPIFGRLGVLTDDGERAECHCCGEYFGHLGNHVWLRHDLTMAEYKSIFGLNATTGLIGPALADKRRAAACAPNGIARHPGRGGTPLTPEQASQLTAGRVLRLQSRIDPKIRALRRENQARSARVRRERGMAEKECVVCGATFRVGRPRREKQTCGDRCLRALRRRDALNNPAWTGEFQRPGARSKRLGRA